MDVPVAENPINTNGDTKSRPAQHMAARLRYEIAVAAVLADLWYLKGWSVLGMLHTTSQRYFGPPSCAILDSATILNALLLAAGFCFVLHWIGRHSVKAQSIAIATIFAAILMRLILDPFRLRALVGDSGTKVAIATLHSIGPSDFGLLIFGLFAPIICFLAAWPMRSAKIIALFWPLALLHVAESALPHIQNWMHPPRQPQFAGRLHATGSSYRVLWIIFDELDEDLAFDHRPASVKLPALDWLRGHGLYATQAHSPADNTLESLPALTTGAAPLNRAEPAGQGKLLIWDSNGMKSWSDLPNVFKDARAAGLNAAVAGWYHPYCSLFPQFLVDCMSYPTPAIQWGTHAAAGGLLPTMRLQVLEELNALPAHTRFDGQEYSEEEAITEARIRAALTRAFVAAREKAVALCADASIDLALFHIPTPHPLGIFDRTTHRLSSAGSYLDNLVLADETLRDIEEALGRTRLGERTAIILSSDHPFRRKTWQERAAWTREMEQATEGVDLAHVPFIVRLPLQNESLPFPLPMNTVVTRELIVAMLRRDVKSPAEVASFLTAHAANVVPMFHANN